MATSRPGMLPTSNVGGNNQTSPGLGSMAQPVAAPFTPMQTAGTVPSSNPMLAASPVSVPAGAVPGGGTYNTASSYAGGQTDINKQLVDIFGKGVGGSMDNLLKNMSGTDSAIFQQWLASQVPAQAQAQASMHQGLGSMGVSGNSSVAGLAEANLAAQFNAQAAAENAHLMDQSIGTTSNILQGAQGAAAGQVAQSGWDIFGQVIGDVGTLAGAVTGLGGLGSMASSLFSGGGLSSLAAPQLTQFGSDVSMGNFSYNTLGRDSLPSVGF